MINKSASKLGTILFLNGNRVDFFIGTNHNTGATIVWQLIAKRETRVTGRNIQKLWDELSNAMNKGECKWIERNITLCVAMPEIPRFAGDMPAERIDYLNRKEPN